MQESLRAWILSRPELLASRLDIACTALVPEQKGLEITGAVDRDFVTLGRIFALAFFCGLLCDAPAAQSRDGAFDQRTTCFTSGFCTIYSDTDKQLHTVACYVNT